MKRYIFEWDDTDNQTYCNTITIPFECDDIDKFISESLEKIDNANYQVLILGIYININKNTKDLFKSSILTLDDWFLEERIIV